MVAGNAERGTIQGWHVLAGMVAFFGVIFAVNGVFLVSALSTHTGIVSQQPYRKGLNYNLRIAAATRQQELGWSGDASIDADRCSVHLMLQDRYGRPVSGLIVRGFIGRPSTEQHDIPVTLAETGSPGTYNARVDRLAPGNWLLQLQASEPKSKGAEVVYRLRKRLWLKP